MGIGNIRGHDSQSDYESKTGDGGKEFVEKTQGSETPPNIIYIYIDIPKLAVYQILAVVSRR